MTRLIIGIAIGTYCVLVGTGFIPVSTNSETQQTRVNKYGVWMILLGAGIIVLRVLSFVRTR